jgi:hypothetical protein
MATSNDVLRAKRSMIVPKTDSHCRSVYVRRRHRWLVAAGQGKASSSASATNDAAV